MGKISGQGSAKKGFLQRSLPLEDNACEQI
jgi:hypothetical protein